MSGGFEEFDEDEVLQVDAGAKPKGIWKLAALFGLDPPKNPDSKQEVWIGGYNFKYLCMPSWPYCRASGGRAAPEFYGRNEWMGVLVGFLMGLQHTVAMAGGLVTPPIIIAGMSDDPNLTQMLISYAFIIVAIASAFQVSGIKIFGKYQYGSGVLSVMGISFATVPIAQSIIGNMMAEGATFDQAYGAVLGTLAVCSVTGMVIAFLPHAVLEFLFPPIVCGVTLTLIGAKLINTGIKQWGGGVFCGDNYKGLTPTTYDECTYFDVAANETMSGACQSIPIIPLRTDNGDVKLLFGSPQYIGMGLLSFCTLVVLEIFGSPFMRNASAMLALVVGYIFACFIKVDGMGYIPWDKLSDAPWLSFLWIKTFPLSIYLPGIAPIMLVYCVLAIESVGDVTGTEEVSREETTGPEHEKRIRGGLLNDALMSLFAALAMTMPVTTFAQNNGVIALTNVASRWTGYFAAVILLTLGIFSKFGAWITTIPHCVLGGVTSFLFANVAVGGVKIVTAGGLSRRNRFILASCLAIGLGVTLCPQWAENNLWVLPEEHSAAIGSIHATVMMILEEGFVVGALIAIFLNLLLPQEAGDKVIEAEEESAAMSFYGPIPVCQPSFLKDHSMSSFGKHEAIVEDEEEGLPMAQAMQK